MNNYFEIMAGVKETTKYPLIMHGVDGMLSRPESEWLCRIPKVIRNGSYVELGTFRGRSTCLIADTIKKENLNVYFVTIDMFDDRGISRRFRDHGVIETQGPQKNSNSIISKVKETFVNKGVSDYITVIRSKTSEAALLFPDKQFDFLFIDADHSYEGVKSDFEAWSVKMNPDGIIAFHDSHREDIIRFHKEITSWKEFDRVDTLSVWKRC